MVLYNKALYTWRFWSRMQYLEQLGGILKKLENWKVETKVYCTTVDWVIKQFVAEFFIKESYFYYCLEWCNCRWNSLITSSTALKSYWTLFFFLCFLTYSFFIYLSCVLQNYMYISQLKSTILPIKFMEKLEEKKYIYVCITISVFVVIYLSLILR